MAARGYNGRVVWEDEISLANLGGTTAADNFIDDAERGIYFSRTNSATSEDGYYTQINGTRFVYIKGENSADDANNRGARLTNIPTAQGGSTAVSVANIMTYGIPVRPGRTYKFTFDYYHVNTIVGSGVDGRAIVYQLFEYGTHSTSSLRGSSNVFLTNNPGVVTTVTATITVGSRTTHLGWMVQATERGAGGLLSEAWLKNIRVEEVLPARQRTRDFGKAILFNGSSDYVDVTSNLATISPATEITVAMWVNLTSIANSNASPLRGSQDEYGFLLVNSGNSNTVAFKVTRQADATQYGSGNAGFLEKGKWYHLVGTAKVGETVKTYINGVLTVSSPETLPSADTIKTLVSHLYIGWEGGASRYFPGYVDKVRIMSRALTAAEALSLYYDETPSDIGSILLAGYDFEDNATDITGTGHDGAVTGSSYATYPPFATRTAATNRVAVRDMGTALSFGAATTDQVTVENSAGEVYDNVSSLTVTAWVYPFLTNVAGNYIFAIPASTGNNRKYLNFDSNGTLVVNPGNAGITTTASFLPRQWYFAVMQVDFATNRVRSLMNNVVVKDWTAFTPGTGGNNADVKIGGQGGVGNEFNGIIDSTRMHNRVLTDTELTNLYLYDVVPGADLLGEWLFNEGSGTTALDTSGNGNNGTITGATYTTDVPKVPRTAV